MSALNRGGYGELVGTAFVVVVSFHLVMGLVGVAVALAAPQLFNVNGAPAESVAQALGALAVLFVVVVLIDALTSGSATGSRRKRTRWSGRPQAKAPPRWDTATGMPRSTTATYWPASTTCRSARPRRSREDRAR